MGGDNRPPAPTAIAIVAAIIALVLIAAGALIFIGDGDPQQQRVMLFMGMVATTVAALVALLRSDQAATRLNGGFEDRVRRIVLEAHADRRSGDPGSGAPDDPLRSSSSRPGGL
jgi:hypothetical protein